MNRFVQIVPLTPRVNTIETVMEGYQIRITKWFNLIKNRWVMDIDNLSLIQTSLGIVLNQGIDLLVSSGRLDLQALVLVNTTPVVGLEASSVNLGFDLKLFYIDMDTYNETVLNGALFSREVYRIDADG